MSQRNVWKHGEGRGESAEDDETSPPHSDTER
jgi:hypothetical protein